MSGALTNRFSWSYSAATAFETCPRKRYWSKYAAWGGWSPEAPKEARDAYRLGKMDSRFTLMGQVVEATIQWLLKEVQAGRQPSAETAYETVARPQLNEAWKASKSGRWREDPKRCICLHEHYYPALHAQLATDWPQQLKAAVMQCIEHFIADIMPRLKDVQPSDEVAVDPLQAVEWEGLRVYAVPDYVFQREDEFCIIDWKAGQPNPSHAKQLAIYAWWARQVHGIAPERMRLNIAYLQTGQVVEEAGSEALIASAEDWIRTSAMDMAAYLKNGDLEANQPCAKEEWDMTPERSVCQRCNFYALCEPEFERLD